MTVRVQATGNSRDGAPLYDVTEDASLGLARNVAELTALEAEEDAALAVVTAMKSMARTESAVAVRQAIAEVEQCLNEEAATEVVDRVTARKKVFTDALAAIAALP